MTAPDSRFNAHATILLVDDTPDNLRLLSRILSERRYKVRAVTTGQRALETARLDPPAKHPCP